MKSGSLITMDYPETIVEKVKNKVFEVDIPKAQASDFKEKHMVVNAIRKKEALRIRYIANQPVPDSIPAEASLEDAYLYLTKSN